MTDRYEHAIEMLYEAALDPSRLPLALQAIADGFDDVGASIAWMRDTGAIGTIVSPGQEEEHSLYESGGWNARDLRAVRAMERGYFFSGMPFTDRHLCSEDEMVSAPIYAEFLKPLGIAWIGSVAVSPDPRIGVLLNVHRSQTRPPFSDPELETIARLGRHLERALRLGIHLFNSEVLNHGLGSALTRLGIGVFALDACNRVLFSNPAGQQLLGDGLALVDGRLVAEQATARPILEDAFRQGASMQSLARSDALMPLLIERQHEKRSLAAFVLPVLPTLSPAAEFMSHARLIVLAIRHEADAPADPSVLRDLLGLTLGEARVAALVGFGLAPREAASKLGISEQTARWNLKQVFSKVGVSRQSELAILLSRLPLR